MTVDGSGRSKPDADQADDQQPDEPTPIPVGSWETPNPDADANAAGSEEAGNDGGDGAPQG